MLAAFVCTFIVCASIAIADPYAPYGGFGSGNIATSQSGCTDLGAGLGIVSNVQACFAAIINEAEVFTAGLSVSGGNMAVTGTSNDITDAGGNISTASNVAGHGDILTNGATAPAVGSGHVAIGPSGHLEQGTAVVNTSQNAAAQTCTAAFICENDTITTVPTSFKMTFNKTFVNKPKCDVTDITNPGITITGYTYNPGGGPYTDVKITFTGASVSDVLIMECPIGNGP